ncbi:histone-lysine N-methyltransferase SETMAR [Trichonephila clavipes]|nr:histone-lysine N-methyltransferase SETMAR [Trichonephila clavipes]
MAELAEKRPHLQKKKIMFHQDNARSHTTAVAMTKIHELRFEILDHTPSLPDLAPSDFFLFRHLKIVLGGQKFSSNEEAITFVNNNFAEKTPSTIWAGYRNGIIAGRSVQSY